MLLNLLFHYGGMKHIFIGVAWPYANGPLHLGTLAGCLLPADIFGRYHRMIGNNVLMVSGSDEHGTPITLTAEKENVSPEEIVERYHQQHKKNMEELGIIFENFTRTSKPFHKEVVHDVFLQLYEKGYIYRKKMLAAYCETCARFLPDRYIEGICPYCGGKARGDQCDVCGKTLDIEELKEARCKICGNEPITKETEHFFFKLSAFKGELLTWLENKKFWKDNVINFTLNWIKSGLKDRAITRDIEWGIPVPIEGFERKRIYVWFEAVIGYLSASKEWAESVNESEKWEKWWKEDAAHYYFLAKDNIPFHTIIWPAMLMGYGGLNLPYDVPANEYLTLSGEQFSKSRDIGIWIPDILKNFDADAIRYYLSINMPEKHDTDWTWDDFVAKNNNELVGIYGNFIHRVLTFTAKNFKEVPEGKSDVTIVEEIQKTVKEVGDSINSCYFKEGIKKIVKLAQRGNQYFNEKAPWDLIKKDREECASVLHTCLHMVKALAICSTPYLPHSAQKIWKMLGYDGSIENQQWEEALKDIEKKMVSTPIPLFQKLELKDIVHEEIQQADFLVAQIVKVDDHPAADKLYVLTIDVGELGRRRIVAGIKPWYTKEDLEEKKIILVANLKPAVIRGVRSQGMLLAADDGEPSLLLTTEKPGASVVFEGMKVDVAKELDFQEFMKMEIQVNKDGLVECKGKFLRDKKGYIKPDRKVREGAKVR